MKALIFGVTGQDGAYLSKSLLAKGYQVTGISRAPDQSGLSNLQALGIEDKLEVVALDASQFDPLKAIVLAAQPDEIYNLSGHSSVASSYKIPGQAFRSLTMGNINILETMRLPELKQCKYFHASSGECFGDTPNSPANEQTPFAPKSPYAVAKAASHWMVKNYRDSYGLFVCSGIMFTHESPLRTKEFVARKICAAATKIKTGSGEKLTLGNIAVQRDWGWAPEYVEAMQLMLSSDKAEDLVLSTGQSFTLQSLVTEVFDQLGLDSNDHVEFSSDLLRPNEILVSAGSPERARESIGWEARYAMPQVIKLLLEAESVTNKD